MLELSQYKFVKDDLYHNFHVMDIPKHPIPLADKMIVNEGYSEAGTYETIGV